jgi:hypothetical protein
MRGVWAVCKARPFLLAHSLSYPPHSTHSFTPSFLLLLLLYSPTQAYYDADEGEDQNLAPAMDANQGQYAFGAPAVQSGAAPAGGFNFGGMPAGAPQGFNFNK